MRWQEQRGSSEPIAFLGLMPLLLFVILAVLQLTLFGYTLVVMESAARDGARAASSGGLAAPTVAEISRGTGIQMWSGQECRSGEGYVTVYVEARVPKLLPGLRDSILTLGRTVVMLREGNCP